MRFLAYFLVALLCTILSANAQSKHPLNLPSEAVEVPDWTVTSSDEGKGSDSKADNIWILGVCLSFFGCCLSNMGINLQKKAHSQKALDCEDAFSQASKDVAQEEKDAMQASSLTKKLSDIDETHCEDDVETSRTRIVPTKLVSSASADAGHSDDDSQAPIGATKDGDLFERDTSSVVGADVVLSVCDDVEMTDKLDTKSAEPCKLAEPTSRSVVRNPLWIAGLLSVAVGSIADLVSFGFASMSLLAPLGAMTLVINMFVAPCFLKEVLTRRHVLVTLLILTGTVIAIVFGSKEGSTYTLDQLLHLYTERLFIIYAVLAAALVLVMSTSLYRIYRKDRVEGLQLTRRELAFQAFAYPFMAGLVGAQSVLLAKSTSEIVQQTISGHNQFGNPVAFFLVLLTVACVVLQMQLLNAGLSRAESLTIVPVYQTSWVVLNSVVGMTYFRDYRHMTVLDAALFALGIAITCVGVLLLSLHSAAPDCEQVLDEEAVQCEASLRRDSPTASAVHSPAFPARAGSDAEQFDLQACPSFSRLSSDSYSTNTPDRPRPRAGSRSVDNFYTASPSLCSLHSSPQLRVDASVSASQSPSLGPATRPRTSSFVLGFHTMELPPNSPQ